VRKPPDKGREEEQPTRERQHQNKAGKLRNRRKPRGGKEDAETKENETKGERSLDLKYIPP